jgi:hypothetical protein
MNINWLVVPTLGISLLLFRVGRRSMRRSATPKSKLLRATLWLLLAVPGLLFPLHYFHWFDHAVWFYRFRSLPFSELAAAGAGLLAGALAEVLNHAQVRAAPCLLAVLALGIVAPHAKPLVAPVPLSAFSEHWRDGVCLQSTQSSCGAASAATVFRSLGVHRSEAEIARECFTYLRGTENWYLARAFRRRGFTVDYRIGQGLPDDLRPPAIAGVRIGGTGHFIAILPRSDVTLTIADPLVGRDIVPVGQVGSKYDFTGFFMEIARKR